MSTPETEGRRPGRPRRARRRRPARAPQTPPQPPRLRAQTNETLVRVLWALPWAAFAVTIIIAGGGIFAGAIVLLAALCLHELFSMARGAQPMLLVAVLVAAGMILAAYFGDQYQMILALACGFPLMFLVIFTRGSVAGITGSAAITVLGIVWIGLPFAHAVLLRELPDHGAALLVDVLVATIVADTAAYAGGRALGRHRLAGEISPNKTVEGLLCGLVGGIAGFWLAGLYQDWLPGVEALAMGAVIAVVAPMGDLFESAVKRDLGVKDSGTLVGPHGGLLDRLDGVFFTIVAGYYLSIGFLY